MTDIFEIWEDEAEMTVEGHNLLGASVAHAKRVLALIKALRECQSQRNGAIDLVDAVDHEEWRKKDDSRLVAILGDR